jgi:hypothetical protein
MEISEIPTNDAAILRRILEPEKPTLSVAVSRVILGLDFSEADKARMRALSIKARRGTLSPEEQEAANSYERVGHLLNLMQSKARRSLKHRRSATDKSL